MKRQSEEDSEEGTPRKKGCYNLRNRKRTVWTNDDTLDSEIEDDKVLIFKKKDWGGEETLEVDSESEYEESEYEESEEEEEEAPKPAPKPKKEVPKLSKIEETYYKKQSQESQNELLDLMSRMSALSVDDGEVPLKFKILRLPISDYLKATVIKKCSTLSEMADNSESYKLKTWVDAFLKIPFGKTIPLPIKFSDGIEKCTEFMNNSRDIMDAQIYGMKPAKTQIMQLIAQLIVNPDSVGNVIALQGPMGVGKTSFARNAIAQVLKRPFEFFTLGGASDIANFVGHSYTYEGSLHGRIVESLMRSKVMNPVFYFDELDKVSNTPHGDEIISMLIHMTDRSQNTQFHDRYFAGVDFDLSQCLFVFSFNDIEKVHPILKDRMTVINCTGYSEADKKIILRDFIWKQMLDLLKFDEASISLTEKAIAYLISEYSDEKGVRSLIRAVERMMMRINMLRISNHESMKTYEFYMDLKFPLEINESVVKKILCDSTIKEPELWRSLYN